MKKFFLSVAVMLAAVSMNVNAMRNSWIFDYTQEEIYQMFHGDNTSKDAIIFEVGKLSHDLMIEGDEYIINFEKKGLPWNMDGVIKHLFAVKMHEDMLNMEDTADE